MRIGAQWTAPKSRPGVAHRHFLQPGGGSGLGLWGRGGKTCLHAQLIVRAVVIAFKIQRLAIVQQYGLATETYNREVDHFVCISSKS